MINVYMSVLNDCFSSKATHKNLINVVNKINEQSKNNFTITLLDLYIPADASKADKLNIFDAPCITCNNEHLYGLVQEDIIYDFLKQFIEND